MTNTPKRKKRIGDIKDRRYKAFDYTVISNRLRTVSWNDNSYPTSVVTQKLKAQRFPLPATVVQSKRQKFKNL